MRRYAFEGLALPLVNLYRDTEKSMIFGVCAGVGDRFGWDLTTIRVITVLALILFPGTFLVYLTAAVLLPSKRLTYHGSRERRLWERRSREGARSRRR